MLDLATSLACAAVAFGVMGATWALSIPLRDASIADVAWGPTLAVIALVALLAGGGGGRSVLLAVLAVLWGARLGWHIGRRNLGHGEDRRYAALRERDSARFAVRSLWSIFGIQATLAWVITLPVQSAAADPTPAGIGAVAIVGVAVALAALALEAVADHQLARFKADPASAGQVMDRGVWSWSRHPNYFGDAAFWWGMWLVALEAGSTWWTVVGPLAITVILTRVTGKRLLESDIGERRPGYAEYVATTSSFVPWPPARVR